MTMAKSMQYYASPKAVRQANNGNAARSHLQQIASAFKGGSVKSTPCGGCASGTKKNCCGH
jgi:hypothetical protein